ncbi:MAG: flavin reductase family protein [Pseudomonadota bacterium]
MSSLDTKALRTAFGRYMTGVTVVTTHTADGSPVGFTANSFSSVSLEPPLLLVCPGRFLSSYNTFAACKSFAVSILSEGQEEVSNTFAGFKGDRFSRVAHTIDDAGNPLIEGAVARFSCNTHQIVEVGDHAILIGEVAAFESAEQPALGYQSGQYFSLGLEHAARLPIIGARICGAIVRKQNSVLLESTPKGFRPPQIEVSRREDLTQILSELLSQAGVDAAIGPVYSVFEDMANGTDYAYLLASADRFNAQRAVSSKTPIEVFPVSELSRLTYTSDAIGKMMRRFASEAQTQDFSLYLGDAERGGTHKMMDR